MRFRVAAAFFVAVFVAGVFAAGVAGVLASLAGPADAQTPSFNLMPEAKSKTPEEKEADGARDKAYRESLKKIPDAKVSSDPWGAVRTTDTPKSPAPAKPRPTKTGSTAN